MSQRLPYAKIIAQLKANTRHVAGGIAQQAIAAIENALLDVVGKAYNVPVCALFGGPIRTKIPVYWSHCSSFRASYGDMLVTVDGTPTAPLRSLDDIRALGAEVKSSGHTSLKTNMFVLDSAGGPARLHMPGFGDGVGSPELNAEPTLIAAVVEQMRTLREGAGPNVSLTSTTTSRQMDSSRWQRR